MAVLSTVVWTYWIAPFLVAGVIGALAVLGVAYLVTVVRPQYPPGEFSLAKVLRRR